MRLMHFWKKIWQNKKIKIHEAAYVSWIFYVRIFVKKLKITILQMFVTPYGRRQFYDALQKKIR